MSYQSTSTRHTDDHTMERIVIPHEVGLRLGLAKVAGFCLSEKWPRKGQVYCNFCDDRILSGVRYKCIICADYNLCSDCHEPNATDSQYTADHTMQCFNLGTSRHVEFLDPSEFQDNWSTATSINTRSDNGDNAWMDPDEEFLREIQHMSLEEEINRELETEIARQTLSMGMPREKVETAIINRLINSKGPYDTAEELINDILTIQLDDGNSETNNSGSVNEPSNRNVTSQQNVAGRRTNVPGQDLEEENRRLRESKLCKICLDNELEIVFIPCGHFASCVSCAPNLENCPVCRSAIINKVRTFIS